MALLEPIAAEQPPVALDATGTARVGGTRITLDTVVEAWLNGATAEEIVVNYDSLKLADIYSVISYNLRHREQVEAYLSRRQDAAWIARAQIESALPNAEFRARLLARKRAE